MGYTSVRTHIRRGYQVRAHARHTSGRHIADILQRDLESYPLAPSSMADSCPHPSWYPIRRLLLDTPYEDSPILAYCCTGCAATKAATEARERVLAEGGE